MGVSPVVNTDLFNVVIRRQQKMAFYSATLSGNLTIAKEFPPVLILDPGGSARTVLLPAEADSKHQVFQIFNTADADEVLSVKEDAGSTTIISLGQDQFGWVFCDGTTWRGYESSMSNVTATSTELNYLDISTLGTGAASKAVVLDSGDDYTWPATGVLTYGVLNDGTTALGATTKELNNVADVSTRVQELTVTGNVTAGVMGIELNHTGTIVAATIANANNHQGLFIVKDTSATGTIAHTLTLTTGTFNGSNNVATLNARDECLAIWFDSTGRGTILENIGTVGLA